MALRPHLNLERTISGILFLDSRYSITREASGRCDNEGINLGWLPSSNLHFEGGYIRRRNTLSHPVPTLNQNAASHDATQRVIDNPDDRQVTSSIWSIGVH